MVQTAGSNMLRHRRVRGKARRADRDPRRQGSIVCRVLLVPSQVCKFFKANRCERGKDCPWQHPATSKAAPAPKADKNTSGDTPKTSPRDKKKKKEKKGSRPSSQDSKDSKGSQSLKSPRSSKGSNAAVCLLQAMVCAATLDSVASYPCLPSVSHDVSQGMPCIKKCVQFSDYPSISNYETDGELWPYTALSRRFAHEFPVDFIPKFDERAISDATLVGAMHEAMVKDLLKGTKTSCKFQCDSDFGCDFCIPAGLTAEPEKPETFPKKGKAAVARIPMDSSHIPWIADTGASQDLLSSTDAEMGCIYESSQPLKFSTANGNIKPSRPGSRSNRPIVLFGRTFLTRLHPCCPWV